MLRTLGGSEVRYWPAADSSDLIKSWPADQELTVLLIRMPGAHTH